MPELFDFKKNALLSFLAIPLGLRAEKSYRRLPFLPAGRPAGPLPTLSIIIPARNEVYNLPVLLRSLCRQRYPGEVEILVVDDHSSDQTSQVAREFKVSVLRLEQDIPHGWLGKPYACHQGALSAKSSWLLFTDADTEYTSSGIARAVSFAVDNDLDGLSLFIHQVARSWTDRLALSTAHAGLFAGQNPANHFLNGQFILLRRQVYLDSNGFEAVAGERLEDVALGNHLHRLGYNIQLINGEDIAQVRMYTDSRHMFLGMARLASGSLKWERSGAMLTVLLITALMSPLIVLLGVLRGKLPQRWLPLTWSAATVSVLPWMRRSGRPALALLAPFGALFVQVAGVYGLVNRLLGRGISWKNRKV